jgi:hypothetical protein
VARPRSLSSDKGSSPEAPARLSVTTAASPRKAMKKSLSSRLGPVGAAAEPAEQGQKFTEKEIYEEMLRQQARRREDNEEREMRKLEKAMKKKKKLETKLGKKLKKEKKKSSKLLDDDSDFSEGDMLVTALFCH